MVQITLTNITLSEIPQQNLLASVYIKRTDEGDETYLLVTDSTIISPNGDFIPPLVIANLEKGVSYTIKVMLQCSQADNDIIFNAVYAQCSDCGLRLTNVDVSKPSLLSSGPLVSDFCILTDYALEWYIDDIFQFTSGTNVAYDPSITLVHSFANEPIQGGNLTVKIKSVVISGIKYTPDNENISVDLDTCIPSFITQNMNCNNGTTPTNTYTHVINYNNLVQSPSSASRSFIFDLDPSTPYFAWYFIGAIVQDTIKIEHISGVNSTIKEYWTIGQNISTTNLLVTPKLVKSPEIKRILFLSNIQVGDYLLITIIPSTINSNTNWVFYGKCLSTVSCTLCSVSDLRKINTIPIFSISNWYNMCSFNWSYLYGCTPSVSLMLRTYHPFSYTILSGMSQFLNSDGVRFWALYGTGFNTINIVKINQGLCYNLSPTETVNIQIVSSSPTIVKVTFSNSLDYQTYKTEINDTLALIAPHFINNPANEKYYQIYSVRLYKAVKCGDAFTYADLYMHYLNTPVWDDVNNSFILNSQPIDYSQYIDPGINNCDSRYETIVNRSNSTNWGVTPALNSVLGVSGAWAHMWANAITTPAIYSQTGVGNKGYHTIYYNDVCDLASYGWEKINTSTEDSWRTLIFDDWFQVTNTSDPINNWEFFRKISPSGNPFPGGATSFLVYKIQNGVVTDNRAAYNLT